ncbi:MAG: hypothetical protein JNM76_01595 [Betaproteobacteria bacterium]|nr:hypothetical protein [Betaproteobacteria bacterium]
MGKKLLDTHPLIRRVIRIFYVSVILVLGVFAWRTWDELHTLRRVPVALPNFWFYVGETQGKPLIQTNGTWLTVEGPQPRDQLQTATLECWQFRMQCVESVALVNMRIGSFLESVPRIHDIETWNEREIVTKPLATDCSSQVVTFNIPEKTVTSVTKLLSDRGECKTPARTERLGDGVKAMAAAGKP